VIHPSRTVSTSCLRHQSPRIWLAPLSQPIRSIPPIRGGGYHFWISLAGLRLPSAPRCRQEIHLTLLRPHVRPSATGPALGDINLPTNANLLQTILSNYSLLSLISDCIRLSHCLDFIRSLCQRSHPCFTIRSLYPSHFLQLLVPVQAIANSLSSLLARCPVSVSRSLLAFDVALMSVQSQNSR
jgi:hypothetical protein